MKWRQALNKTRHTTCILKYSTKSRTQDGVSFNEVTENVCPGLYIHNKKSLEEYGLKISSLQNIRVA